MELGVGLGLEDGVGLLVGVLVGDGFVVFGVGFAGSPLASHGLLPQSARTRKRNCACRETESTKPWPSLPGIETTTCEPCVATVASVTPLPLTRWRMMLAA